MVRVLHAEPDFGELFTAHLLTRNSRLKYFSYVVAVGSIVLGALAALHI